MANVLALLEEKRVGLGERCGSFARLLGLSEAQYSRAKQGVQDLPKQTAAKVAEILGVLQDDLPDDWRMTKGQKPFVSPPSPWRVYSFSAADLAYLASVAEVAGRLSVDTMIHLLRDQAKD